MGIGILKTLIKAGKSLGKHADDLERLFAQHGELLSDAIKNGGDNLDDVLQRLEASGDEGIRALAKNPALKETLETVSKTVGRHGDALDNLSRQLDNGIETTADFRRALINSDIPDGTDLFRKLDEQAEAIVRGSRRGYLQRMQEQLSRLRDDAVANPGELASRAGAATARGAWSGTKAMGRWIKNHGFTRTNRVTGNTELSMARSLTTVTIGTALADRATGGLSTSALAWGAEHAVGFSWDTAKIFSGHIMEEIYDRIESSLPEDLQDKKILYATDENDDLIIFSPEQYEAAYGELPEDEQADYMTPDQYEDNMPAVIQSLRDMAVEAGIDVHEPGQRQDSQPAPSGESPTTSGEQPEPEDTHSADSPGLWDRAQGALSEATGGALSGTFMNIAAPVAMVGMLMESFNLVSDGWTERLMGKFMNFFSAFRSGDTVSESGDNQAAPASPQPQPGQRPEVEAATP